MSWSLRLSESWPSGLQRAVKRLFWLAVVVGGLFFLFLATDTLRDTEGYLFSNAICNGGSAKTNTYTEHSVKNQHRGTPKSTTKVVTRSVRVRNLEESAKKISRGVTVVSSDSHLPNVSYFQLKPSPVSHIYPTWLLSPQPCPPGKVLLVVIPSVDSKSSWRMAIRETWASMAYNFSSIVAEGYGVTTFSQTQSPGNNSRIDSTVVKVVFFLGKRRTTNMTTLQREHQQYRDLAMADFSDSYRNLSVKMTTAIQWASDYCSSLRYLLKVDEDTVVNIPLLLKVLDIIGTVLGPTVTSFMLGRVHAYWSPNVARRGQWRVDRNLYPLSKYPRYLYGNSYLITGDVIRQLRHASLHMPVVPNEDAYLTGILAKTLNITRLNTMYMSDRSTAQCLIPTNELVSQTSYTSPEAIRHMWALMRTVQLTHVCSITEK